MQNLRQGALALFVLVSFILTGCGGGSSSGSTSPDTTANQVSGLASAPPATVALLEPSHILELALEMVFPPLAAAITGLEPITGAQVELIRVDNAGEQIGDVIATTRTSATGNYTLTLPAGVDLAGNLVVRIGATANEQIRSQVVSRTVNISPVSEYVLRKFIERGADLDSLALDTVVSLSGKVEEFDIAAQAGDLSALLERLEQDAGDLVNSQIDLALSEPASATALNGNYQGSNLTLVLGASESAGPGTFETQVFKDSFELKALSGGNVEVTFTGGPALYAQLIASDNNSGAAQANTEIDLEDGGQDTVPATYTDNNVLTIQAPFYEEIEPENDIGRRSPATDFRLQPVPGMGLMFAAPAEVLIAYALNENDAVDATRKVGEELKRGLEAFVRTPNDATTADLTGEFGRVYLGTIISDSGQIEAEAEASTITFDGATGTLDASAADRYSIVRANNASVTGGKEGALAETAIPFSVNANGAVSFGQDEQGVALPPTGFVDDSFQFVAEANLGEAKDDLNQPIGPFMSKTLLLRLPETSGSTPAVSGKQYRIFSVGLGAGVGTTGDLALIGSRFDSKLTMGTLTNGVGQATRDLSIAVVRKTALESPITLSQRNSSLTTEVTVQTDGTTVMTVADGDRLTTYDGFFNAEGSLGIFMVRVAEGTAPANQLALAVLVEQP